MKKFAYLIIGAVLILFGTVTAQAQCSPFMGIGNVQFLDNNGVPLTSGVLYSFQAGTSTQQATFIDSMCATQNVNPITFTTGARVSIWLTTALFYKFQLCLQNDGPTCAAGDVLFSVDQVPGGASGGGGGGGSPFISASPNPATSGILRCASGDQCVVFRNAANSANLAITKDSSDVLSWAGGIIKLPEIFCNGTAVGFDYLCADSSSHRLKETGNGGSQAVIAVQGQDISPNDFITQIHFGAAATPLSSTAPATNQSLQWNGTNIVGGGVVYSTVSSATTGAISAVTMATAGGSGNLYRFSWYLTQTALGVSCTSASLVQPEIIYTDPNSGSSTTFFFNGLNFPGPNNGTVGPFQNTPVSGGNMFYFRAKANTAVQYLTSYAAGTACSPSPAYQIYPLLEQLTFN